MAVNPQKKTFDSLRTDFTPYGFTCERWKPARMPRADRHNEVELNLLCNGSLSYMMGGRRTTLVDSRLAVFWAATPHQIVEHSGPGPYYVATVPLAWFLQWKLPETFVQAVMAGEVVCEAVRDRLSTDTILFEQWIEDLSGPSPETLKTVQLEMEARFRRMAFSYAGTVGGGVVQSLKGHHGGELTKIEQMAAFVAQHYTEQIRLADIGDAVGLNPNYAAGLFQKTFGTTLNEFVTEHRISHAQRLLVTTDSKILEAAIASGFNTLSRFNVAFKQRCGCTPRYYRKNHRRN